MVRADARADPVRCGVTPEVLGGAHHVRRTAGRRGPGGREAHRGSVQYVAWEETGKEGTGKSYAFRRSCAVEMLLGRIVCDAVANLSFFGRGFPETSPKRVWPPSLRIELFMFVECLRLMP